MWGKHEYKFVRIKLSGGIFSGKFDPSYQEIIHQHAVEGWRLITIFGPAREGYGRTTYADIIFEKQT